MRKDQRGPGSVGSGAVGGGRGGGTPGKTSLVQQAIGGPLPGKQALMRQAVDAATAMTPGAVSSSSAAAALPGAASPGAPATAGAVPYRAEMEAAFGQSFASVTVRTGEDAALREIGARAATRGEHIDFADASPSRETVGHELAHVVQHRRHGDGGTSGMSRPDSPAEREAAHVGERVARGEPAPEIREAARADRSPTDVGGRDRVARTSDAGAGADAGGEVSSVAAAPSVAASGGGEPAAAAGTEREATADAERAAAAASAERTAAGAERALKPADPAAATGAASAGAPVRASAGAAPEVAAASAPPVSDGQPDLVGEAIARLESTPPAELEDALDALRGQLPALQQQESEAVASSVARAAAPAQAAAAPSQVAPPARPAAEQVPDVAAQLAAMRRGTVAASAAIPAPVRPAPAAPSQQQPGAERGRREQAAHEARAAQQRAQPDRLVLESHAPTSAGPRPRLQLGEAGAPATLERDRRALGARAAAHQQEAGAAVAAAASAALPHVPPSSERPLRLQPPPPPPVPPAAPAAAGPALRAPAPRRPGGEGEGARGGTDEGPAAAAARGRVQAMRAQHAAQRATYLQQLDAVQAQGDERLRAARAAQHAREQAIRTDAAARNASIQVDWRARAEGDRAQHAAEAGVLHARASELVVTHAQQGEARAEQVLVTAEQTAVQRKAARTAAARATLDRGRQRAAEILSAVSLPCDGGYEARALAHGGVLLRQNDDGAGWEPDDTARSGSAAGRTQEQQEAAELEAQRRAQGEVDNAVAEAQESLDALVTEVDELMSQAQTLSGDQLAAIQQVIEARLAEIYVMQVELARRADEEGDTAAAAALMQINMNMVEAMGQVLALAQTHRSSDPTAPAALTDDPLFQTIQTGYRNAILSNQQRSTYYIFVPPARLDSDDILTAHADGDEDTLRYPNLPYSELGGALLNGSYEVSPTQVSYFQGMAEGAQNWGPELLAYMNTLAMLDPDAEFVLGGHSSSGRAVADATASHIRASGEADNRVRELLLFDPHVNYPTSSLADADAALIERNVEISIFQPQIQVGTDQVTYEYDGNQDLLPYPAAWRDSPNNNMRALPVRSDTPAELRHYWFVGNMGAEGANMAATSATNRRERVQTSPEAATPEAATPGTDAATPSSGTATPTTSSPQESPITGAPYWPAVEAASGTGTVINVASTPNKGLSLRERPLDGVVLVYIPENARIEIFEQTTIRTQPGVSVEMLWLHVHYTDTTSGQTLTGWVYEEYVNH